MPTNQQGWLKGVNSMALDTALDMGKDGGLTARTDGTRLLVAAFTRLQNTSPYLETGCCCR
jgi:phage anti-repressor protein